MKEKLMELVAKFKALPQKTQLIIGGCALGVILLVIFIIAGSSALSTWEEEAEKQYYEAMKHIVGKLERDSEQNDENSKTVVYTITIRSTQKFMLTYIVTLTEKPGLFGALFADSPKVTSAKFKTPEEEKMFKLYCAEEEISRLAAKKALEYFRDSIYDVRSTQVSTYDPDNVFTGDSWKGTVHYTDFVSASQSRAVDFVATVNSYGEIEIEILKNTLRYR